MSETVAAPHHTAGKGNVMVRVSILAVIAVVAPAPILHALGFGSIAAFVGLAGLGGAVAVLVLGPRGGLIAAVGKVRLSRRLWPLLSLPLRERKHWIAWGKRL